MYKLYTKTKNDKAARNKKTKLVQNKVEFVLQLYYEIFTGAPTWNKNYDDYYYYHN